MNDLDSIWNELTGGIPPVAYNLKWELSDQWVRFHSLPKSKRYPDSDVEMQEIIRRHNEVLSKLFSHGETIYQIEMTWPDESGHEVEAKGFKLWRTDQVEEDDIESNCSFFFKETQWEPKCLDWAIIGTANDEIHNFLIVGHISKCAYHPYDGGMDLILPTTEEAVKLQKAFKEYLSSHPEGL